MRFLRNHIFAELFVLCVVVLALWLPDQGVFRFGGFGASALNGTGTSPEARELRSRSPSADAGPLLSSTRSIPVEQREPVSGEYAGSGCSPSGAIAIVPLHAGECAEPPTWRAENASGRARSGQGWRIEGLAPGRWTLTSEDHVWAFLTSDVLVHQDRVSSAWLSRLVEARLLVVDIDGAPLAGASLSWTPASEEGCEPGLNPSSLLGRTDAAGRWSGEVQGPVYGRLDVYKRGFLPYMRLHDWATEGTCSVTLRDAGSESREVRLVDARSGGPAADVTLQLLDGSSLSSSDAMGRLTVPADGLAADTLRLVSDRYGEVIVEPAELAPQTRLWPMASCRITSGSPASFDVFVLGVDWPDDVEGAVASPRLSSRSSADGVARLQLPEGVASRLIGVSGSASSTLQVVAESEAEYELAFTGERSLVVRVYGPDGAPVSVATAEVRYDSLFPDVPTTWLSAAGEDSNELVVGSPDSVESIRIEAPGCAPAHLVRRSGRRNVDGSLSVRLEPGVRARLHVTDEAGAPLAGVRLILSGTEWVDPASIPFVDDSPTSHPGWHAQRPVSTQVTDRDGVAEVSVRPGPYEVRAILPAARNPGSSLYAARAPLVVRADPGEQSIELRIPSPVWLILHAEDALTGAAVAEFRVDADGGASRGLSQRSSHGAWEGWVPRDVREVTLRAAGYRPHVVDLGAMESGAITSRLRRSDVLFLRLTADDPLPETLSLRYRVLEEPSFQARTVLSGVIEFVAGQGALELPYDDGVWVEILELETDERTLAPSPARFLWAPSREAERTLHLTSRP